jgi:branched-chain amino acid transport system substrate-binding protein
MKSLNGIGAAARTATSVLAAGAVAVSLAACAGSGDDAAESSGGSESGPIKIGYVNALTGAYAVLGGPEYNGAKLAVSDINAEGGVCDRKLDISTSVDDQGKPNLSVAGIRKLAADDSIPVVFGPGITPNAISAAPVAESLKKVFVVETAQRDPWENRKYVFSVLTPQDIVGELIIKYAKEKLGGEGKTVAILNAAVPYAQNGGDQLRGLAKENGWKVVASDTYDPTALSFTSQASKVAKADADALLIWGAGAPGDAQLLKQVRAAGYEGPAIGDIIWTLPFIPEVAGAAADTMVGFTQLNTVDPSPEVEKFLTGYQKTYDEEATFLSAASYDGVHVVAKAIEKAGCKTDPTGIAEAMVGLQYEGVNGPWNYTEDYKGGPPSESFKATTFKDGKPAFAE